MPAQEWDDEEPLPPVVLRAPQNPRVLAALADLFRRNRFAAGGMGPEGDPERARILARQALVALLRPEAARLTDVGGLRLHLAVPSALYPSPAVIHASAWDDEAGVWRLVAEIALETEKIRVRDPPECLSGLGRNPHLQRGGLLRQGALGPLRGPAASNRSPGTARTGRGVCPKPGASVRCKRREARCGSGALLHGGSRRR